jgi:hypothetical protein
MGRGRSHGRGKEVSQDRVQKPKDEEKKPHNHLERGGSSQGKQYADRNTFPRARGRGRGSEIKYFVYGNIRHKSWECPDRKINRGETVVHPIPYKVLWLQKGHQVTITEQCLVEFKIGGYRDEILCDVIPMDVCHIFLGRPWQYDKNVIHDGIKNTYTLDENGRMHMLLPIEDKKVKANTRNTILLMSGKELLYGVKKSEEMKFDVVRKPRFILTSISIDDLPEKIQELLENFIDIVVDDLPCSLYPIRSISHHIDLILGAILQNKEMYRMMSAGE